MAEIEELSQIVVSGTKLIERNMVEIKMNNAAMKAVDELSAQGGCKIDLGENKFLNIPANSSKNGKKLTIEIKKITEIDPNSESEEILEHPLSGAPSE
jgi:hypothetical protein